MRLGKMSSAILLVLAVYSVTGQRPIYPDLPDPRLVLVGPTGAGKSSLANAFLGCDPRDHDHECLFNVCSSMDSCTKETTYGMGQWLGTGQNFTVVDSPGFGDSDNQDDELIEEMMDILANVVQHSDTMLLVLDGTTTRFTTGLQTMLKRMTLMFGVEWWDYVIIGVSFWAYDQDSIDERICYPEYPDYCKDESWYSNEITTQMNEKFNINKNFTFVFTDSWSQTPGPPGFNTDDPLQQEHWQAETKILWDITTSRNNSFPFMTINDFMEENARQKAEIKWLNDVITSNITELQNNFRNLEENLIPAVGSIIPWIPTGPSPGDHPVNPIKIPLGWQRCDGSLISEISSPFFGLFTPNINGQELFLRGGIDAKATTIQDEMIRGHDHSVLDGGHIHNASESSHTHRVYSAEYNIRSTDEIYDEHKTYYDGGCYERQASPCRYSDDNTQSASGKVTISSTTSKITVESFGGEETRPKNMAVVYIIRIF